MKSKNKYTDLVKKSAKIRKIVLDMIVSANASHIGSSYSVVELLVYLYENILKIDPKKPLDPDRDRFILSKGWAVSTLYAILAEKRFFDKQLLREFCQNGSRLIGAATRNGIPGIEANTGSMGHGLPLGVGMALAAKIQKRKFRVFVIIGDGELDEGSTWESILQAGNYHLDNLIVIVDHNKWQSFGRIKDILDLNPMREKWEAFNWSAREINGHDFAAIDSALSHIPSTANQPTVIIAHTIKGKGVSVFEDKNEWHYQTPKESEISIAKKELKI